MVSWYSAAGIGVGDDPAAGLDVNPAVLDERGAQGDAGVQVAVVAEIAERARVESALNRLLLGDDLHRPDLGRSADRARRERRAHEVERGPARAQSAPRPGRRCASRANSARPPSVRERARCRTRRRGRCRCGPRSTSIRCSARSLASARSSFSSARSSAARGAAAFGCRRSAGSRQVRRSGARAPRATRRPGRSRPRRG